MIVIRVPEASIVNTEAYLNQPEIVMKVELTVAFGITLKNFLSDNLKQQTCKL